MVFCFVRDSYSISTSLLLLTLALSFLYGQVDDAVALCVYILILLWDALTIYFKCIVVN